MSLIGRAEELRCECHLERGVCESARDGVHRGIRVVTRRQGEVRVVLAPRRVAGKEPSHSTRPASPRPASSSTHGRTALCRALGRMQCE
eukprot:scaffold72242_cov60-Phaeocystis_antarctica.AAC.12